MLNDHFKPTYSVDNISHAARRKAGQLGGRYMATFSDYFTIARRQWTCTPRHYTPTLLLNENVLKEGNAGQMNSLLIYYYTVSNAIFILHRMCAMCNAAFVLHF